LNTKKHLQELPHRELTKNNLEVVVNRWYRI
jgi:hypothetical protein